MPSSTFSRSLPMFVRVSDCERSSVPSRRRVPRTAIRDRSDLVRPTGRTMTARSRVVAGTREPCGPWPCPRSPRARRSVPRRETCRARCGGRRTGGARRRAASRRRSSVSSRKTSSSDRAIGVAPKEDAGVGERAGDLVAPARVDVDDERAVGVGRRPSIRRRVSTSRACAGSSARTRYARVRALQQLARRARSRCTCRARRSRRGRTRARPRRGCGSRRTPCGPRPRTSRISVRTSRMPGGSRPFAGSSRMRRSGSFMQRGRDPEPLLHAERVGREAGVGPGAEPDLVERGVDPLRADAAACGRGARGCGGR